MSSGTYWKLSVVAVLALTGVLNFIVYSAASKSSSPIMESKPYERGLAFDTTIRQEKFGASLAVAPEVTSDENQVCVAFAGEVSRLQAASGPVTLRAIRLAADVPDQTLTLTSYDDSARKYCVAGALGARGLWWFEVALPFPQEIALFRFTQTVS